jgi:ankyrin repeat protein
MKGHRAVFRLLVERDDVEVDSKDIFGRTPLWWAANRGCEAVVRLLMERNDVEANLEDWYGLMPAPLYYGDARLPSGRRGKSYLAIKKLLKKKLSNGRVE